MKKSDLKTGMVLVFESGDRAIVLKSTADGDIVSGDTWFPFNSPTFTDDLKTYQDQVVEVWQPESNRAYGYGRNIEQVKMDLIWQRSSAKQSKLEELEKRQREITDELKALREGGDV